MSGEIMLGPSANSMTVLNATFDSIFDVFKVGYKHRSLGGKIYKYKTSKFRHWELSEEMESSLSANLVNSWWLSKTNLVFTENSSLGVNFNARIINRTTPLNQYELSQYSQFYLGNLIVEEY